MNDRELLELAAKAANYFIEDENDDGSVWVYPVDSAQDEDGDWPIFKWSPLTDDGDALRLAVKLDMKVYKGEAYPYRKEYADYPIHLGCAIDEDEEPDQYAATRRAIVCAAAAIGKAMP